MGARVIDGVPTQADRVHQPSALDFVTQPKAWAYVNPQSIQFVLPARFALAPSSVTQLKRDSTGRTAEYKPPNPVF